MRINNNIMAMNTHRQYTMNNSKMSGATERLSSGYRINRAGDDAAGLAISEKMRSQIRGLDMASKNSEDAISLVQTAEGALEETHSILQRMNELAVQSSSDTNNDSVDRDALQAEFAALSAEIDDIADKTSFNGKKLLNGSFGSTASVNSGSVVKVGLDGVKDIKFEGFADTEGDADGTQYTIQFSDGGGGADYTVTLDPSGDAIALSGVANTAGAHTMSLDFGDGRMVTIEFADTAAADEIAATDTLVFDVKGDAAKIQTGVNEGDTLSLSIGNTDSTELGVDTLDISTQDGAAAAITSVQAAINTVSTQRANLGAIQNRLEHKINNLETSSENLTAAESRIRDVDMASEMTEYTQTSILVQAATSMLAQANAAPQNVLSLLQ